MQGFLAGGFVLPKAAKSWSLISNFSSYSSMLTILWALVLNKHVVQTILTRQQY
jgi:hypothetical protein